MTKTIQGKQTYLLTSLFGWNRWQIILVLCFSAERMCAFETHYLPPASLQSPPENQEATNNYREM